MHFRVPEREGSNLHALPEEAVLFPQVDYGEFVPGPRLGAPHRKVKPLVVAVGVRVVLGEQDIAVACFLIPEGVQQVARLEPGVELQLALHIAAVNIVGVTLLQAGVGMVVLVAVRVGPLARTGALVPRMATLGGLQDTVAVGVVLAQHLSQVYLITENVVGLGGDTLQPVSVLGVDQGVTGVVEVLVVGMSGSLLLEAARQV